MSQIINIYTQIQAMNVSVGGNVVKTNNLATHKGFVNTTPIRILAPLTTNDDGRTLQPMTFGGRSSITWRITDMMLWAGINDGSGIAQHAPSLVEYMGAFADAFVTQMGTDRTLGLNNVAVESIDDIEIGEYEYPVRSGNWYYGCLTTWRVRENL